MKKELLFSVAIATFFMCVYEPKANAQSWSITGNTNATASSKLGTKNKIALNLYTNDKSRLLIDAKGNFDFNKGQVYLDQSAGFLGIGTTSPIAKLHSEGAGTAIYGNSTSGSFGIYGKSSYLGVFGEGDTYGVYGYSNAAYGVFGYSGTGYGIYGSGSTSYDADGSTGVYGGGYYAVHGKGTYGVWGESTSYLGVYGTGVSYGVYGSASSSTGYGVYGTSNNIGVYASGSAYALYGASDNGIGVKVTSNNNLGGSFYSTNYYGMRSGTGLSSQNWAGVFDGSIYTFGTYQTSDRKLKKNIKEFAGAMDIIEQLKPMKYEFIREGKLAALHLPEGNHYGLIAQDLQEVLPQLVKEVENDLSYQENSVKPVMITATDGKETPEHKEPSSKKSNEEKFTIKAVNYTELIPIMIKAMQEQQATINKQNEKIEALTQMVNQLSKNTVAANTLKPNGAFLGNAVPNPAAKYTRISYTVPNNYNKAELVIYNAAAQKINQVLLNNSGIIDLDISAFRAGIYSYTLIVDGVIVNTKKMVIAK